MGSTIETPEITEEHIKLARDRIKFEYGISVPKKAIPGFIEKGLELCQWVQTEMEDFSDAMTDETAEEYRKTFKDKYGKNISKSEAFRQLQGVTAFTIYKERVRLSAEMRSIVVKYKKVDYSQDILEKLKILLACLYNIKLNEAEIKRVLYRISKFIWQNVDLAKSVDTCFNDMIKFKDRENRGKSLAGLDNHEEIKKALDTILRNLKRHQ